MYEFWSVSGVVMFESLFEFLKKSKYRWFLVVYAIVLIIITIPQIPPFFAEIVADYRNLGDKYRTIFSEDFQKGGESGDWTSGYLEELTNRVSALEVIVTPNADGRFDALDTADTQLQARVARLEEIVPHLEAARSDSRVDDLRNELESLADIQGRLSLIESRMPSSSNTATAEEVADLNKEIESLRDLVFGNPEKTLNIQRMSLELDSLTKDVDEIRTQGQWLFGVILTLALGVLGIVFSAIKASFSAPRTAGNTADVSGEKKGSG